MMVTKTPHAYFASLSLGFQKQLIVEKYNRNDMFIEDLESNIVSFWEDHVLTKIAPEPVTIQDAQKIYNSADDEEVLEADDSIYNICRNLNDLNSDSKTINDQIKEMKLELMKSLENRQEFVYNGSSLCTWRKTKDSIVFDKKTFQADHPHLYDRYTKTRSGSRRFVLKKMEE
jgi:predicted phage-related endonuclease